MKQLLLSSAFALSLTASSLAAPPANDNFANEIVLAGNSPISSVNNTDATNEASDPSVAGYRTVWWKYRPSVTGRLTVSTTNSAGFTASVVAYLGNDLSSLRQIAGSSANGNPATFTFPVTANTDYHISVGSYFSNNGSSYYGNIVLGLSLDTQADVSYANIPNVATMANDLFAQRVLLDGNVVGSSVAAIGYNMTATNEAAANEPASAGYRTLWWTYRPARAGRLTISTTGSDSFTASVIVYTGNVLASLRQAAGSPANGNPASVTFPVTANTDYQVSVGSYFSNNGSSYFGNIVLGFLLDTQADVSSYPISSQASAANDNYANRVALSGGTVSAIGYNTAAGRDPLEPLGTHERTIWWDWTAPAAGTTIVDLTGSDAISKWVTVWRGGSISSLTQVATSTQSNTPTLTFTATAGETYHLAVGNNSTSVSGGSVVLTIGGPSGAAGSNVPNVTLDQAIHLRWFATNGLRYQVQRSPDLSTWTNVGSLIVGNGTFKDYFDPITSQNYFYRIFLQP